MPILTEKLLSNSLESIKNIYSQVYSSEDVKTVKQALETSIEFIQEKISSPNGHLSHSLQVSIQYRILQQFMNQWIDVNETLEDDSQLRFENSLVAVVSLLREAFVDLLKALDETETGENTLSKQLLDLLIDFECSWFGQDEPILPRVFAQLSQQRSLFCSSLLGRLLEDSERNLNDRCQSLRIEQFKICVQASMNSEIRLAVLLEAVLCLVTVETIGSSRCRSLLVQLVKAISTVSIDSYSSQQSVEYQEIKIDFVMKFLWKAITCMMTAAKELGSTAVAVTEAGETSSRRKRLARVKNIVTELLSEVGDDISDSQLFIPRLVQETMVLLKSGSISDAAQKSVLFSVVESCRNYLPTNPLEKSFNNFRTFVLGVQDSNTCLII